MKIRCLMDDEDLKEIGITKDMIIDLGYDCIGDMYIIKKGLLEELNDDVWISSKVFEAYDYIDKSVYSLLDKELYYIKYKYKASDSDEVTEDIWHIKSSSDRLIQEFMEKQRVKFAKYQHEILEYSFTKVREDLIINLP